MVLIGSCPWPGPWFRSYGAHLHLQAREDPNTNGDDGSVHLSPAREAREHVQWTCDRGEVPRAWASGPNDFRAEGKAGQCRHDF